MSKELIELLSRLVEAVERIADVMEADMDDPDAEPMSYLDGRRAS